MSNTPTIKPVGDRLFIRAALANEKKGSLFLPEETREKIYIVAAAGPMATRCEEGSRVILNMKACGKTTVDGTEYYVTEEKDLLAVIET